MPWKREGQEAVCKAQRTFPLLLVSVSFCTKASSVTMETRPHLWIWLTGNRGLLGWRWVEEKGD